MTENTPPDDDGETSEESGTEWMDAVATVAVFLGIGALGFGTGLHVSLMLVQSAAIDNAGPVVSLEMAAGDMYPVIVVLQTWANRALYAAGLLLVGGGIVSERANLRDQLDELSTWVEDSGGDDGD